MLRYARHAARESSEPGCTLHPTVDCRTLPFDMVGPYLINLASARMLRMVW